MVAFVFVKTTSVDLLFEGGKYILDYGIKDYLYSGYIPPAHRYLFLAYVPLLASTLFFFISFFRKKNMISAVLLLIIFGIYYISISVFYHRDMIFNKDKIQYKYSIWRQYSDLIYDYPINYYIPYYEYPKHNESIKWGINRITDIYVPDSGIIALTNVHSNGNQWKILQIITEFEPHICPDIEKLVCITNGYDTLNFTPLKPLNETYRFIIFRFDDFLMLKEFKFVDKNNTPLKLKNLIRLVGKYE